MDSFQEVSKSLIEGILKYKSDFEELRNRIANFKEPNRRPTDFEEPQRHPEISIADSVSIHPQEKQGGNRNT